MTDWDLARVVAELRDARGDARSSPSVHGLPSRDALVDVMQGLRSALFPLHFGAPDIAGQSVDYFVGHALDAALRTLEEQVRRALAHDAPDVSAEELSARASEITKAFAARLRGVRVLLESDIRAGYAGDPAAKSRDEVVFCYPGITALTHHRIAHELYALGMPLLARIMSEIAHSGTGIDIHPGAQIGASFFIDHGTGVVIGETTIIGERVRLYQGVTLGARRFPLDEQGMVQKNVPRHPVIEDDVVVYAGATILGRVTIGRGSTIGGNVWLTRSVPPGSTIAQAQARGESFESGGGI